MNSAPQPPPESFVGEDVTVHRPLASWEFSEWGAWKSMPPYENRFLEEQYLNGVETCGMNITWTENYEWNFPELRQQRKHFFDGAWHVVKQRRIRRILVLVAPRED